MSNIQPAYSDFKKAIKNNRIKRLKKLLATSGPNVTNKYKKTPLMYALSVNNVKAVDLLLTHGANVRVTTTSGKHTEEFIQKKSFRKVIQIYEKHGKRIKTYAFSLRFKNAQQTIYDLIIAFQYTTKQSLDGICHGLMGVARHYIVRGEKSTQTLIDLYQLLSSKPATELKKEIEAAENIHKEVALTRENLQKTHGSNSQLVEKQIKNTITEKLKAENLDPLLLKVRPFIQCIALYQRLSMRGYNSVFEKNVANMRKETLYKQSIFTVFPLVSTPNEAKQGLVILHDRGSFGAFDKQKLKKLLQYWRNKLLNQPIDPVTLQLNSLLHTMSVYYVPKKDRWVMQNNTNLKFLSGNNSSTLAKWVYKALFDEKCSSRKHIVMSSFVFTNKKDETTVKSHIKYEQHDPKWDNIHTFFHHQVNHSRLKLTFNKMAPDCTNTKFVSQYVKKMKLNDATSNLQKPDVIMQNASNFKKLHDEVEKMSSLNNSC